MFPAQRLNVNISHGGKRKGAGRKPAPDPVFAKNFRASESERIEFLSLLTGDARKDFEIVFHAVKASRLPTQHAPDVSTRR